MSTHGARTRHLFSASVTVERSFEDYGQTDDQIAEQVNEPKLEIRVGRFLVSVLRWNLPNTAKHRWNWITIDPRLHIIRTPLAQIELYAETPFEEDERYSYSGDWGPHHDRLIR